MQLSATYQELNSYIQVRTGQPISLSFAEGDELGVTYTQRIFIKDVNICEAGLHVEFSLKVPEK